MSAAGSATSVEKGATPQFSAAVAGTNSPAQTVTWGITTTDKHSGTTINASGLLTVSANETAASLTVRATSTADATKSGTATVTVTTPDPGSSMATAIPLTENQWEDGNITTAGGEQWFSFTATASTQYIHASFGTLNASYGIYVQMYDSGGAMVGNETALYGSTRSVSRPLTSGQTYYIKVWPYGSGTSGTYQIAFNTSELSTAITVQLPSNAIQLTENQWTDGDLPTSSDVQWFTFTATATTQYIHVAFRTLNYLSVQVYDSGGATVESQSTLSSSTNNISRTLTAGQTYYVRVRPLTSDGINRSGTYWIGFNTSELSTAITVQLPSDAIQLTANQWTNGNLPTSNSVQWFTFIATAPSNRWQYFHTDYMSSSLYMQVYDSIGTAVGSETDITQPNSLYREISQTLTEGETYYIRVRPYSGSPGGTYRIAFTASAYIPLTENQWANGDLLQSSSDRFTFTATASEQYIHAAFGTLKTLYVQVYDSSGATVGSQVTLSDSTTNTSLTTLTEGQTYSIRVTSYRGGSGTYQIGFNTSITAPTSP